MPIEVILASDQSVLVKQLVHLKDQSRQPVVVLCRTTAIQTMLGHLLAHEQYVQQRLDRSLKLTTFDRWIADLWIRYGDGRRQIDEVQRRIYLSRILDEIDTPLPPILTSVSGKSVLESVCAIIGMGSVRTSSTYETVRMVERIAQQYQKKITADGFIDTGEIVSYLCAHLASFDETVVLYGFSDLTNIQITLLHCLVPLTTISVLGVGEAGSLTRENVLQVRDQIHAESRDMEEADVGSGATPSDHDAAALSDPEAKLDAGEAQQNKVLRELASQFYGLKKESIIATPREISFQLAAGDTAQIVSIVSNIQTLQKADGMRRIAVVLPNLKDHTPRLVRELERHSIAYQFDTELPLSATEFGIAFHSLLTLMSSELDAATIFSFTSSPFSDWTIHDAIAFDRSLRTTPPVHECDPGKVLDKMTRWVSSESDLSHPISESLSSVARGGTLHAWQEILDGMLAQGIKGFLSSSFQYVVSLAAYRAISIVLDELAQLEDNRISPVTLLGALAGVKVQINPVYGTRDVVLTTPRRIDGLLYDAVIVAGTDSRSFEGMTDLSGSEQILNHLGVGRYANKSEQYIEDALSSRNRYYEASLLRSPQKHLSIIYQTHDNEGQELQPSSFLEEVVAQFQSGDQTFKDTLEILAKDSEKIQWDDKRVMQALNLDEGSIDIIGTVAISERGAHTISMSYKEQSLRVTEIEQYAQCPYRWFLSSFIGGEEFDRDHDARDSGIYVHALLERIFTRWTQQGFGAVTDESLPQILALADEVIGSYENEDYQRLKTDHPDEFLRIGLFVKKILEDEPKMNLRLESRVEPTLFETKIRSDDKVVIEKVPITGTVDRIDVADEYFVITDYKSSVGKGGDKMILDRDLQVGLYLLALRQLAAREGHPLASILADRQPAALIYRSYRTGGMSHLSDKSKVSMDVRNLKLKPEEHEVFAAQLEMIEKLAREAIRGIQQGVVALPHRDPDQNYICTYCPRGRCPQRKEKSW